MPIAVLHSDALVHIFELFYKDTWLRVLRVCKAWNSAAQKAALSFSSTVSDEALDKLISRNKPCQKLTLLPHQVAENDMSTFFVRNLELICSETEGILELPPCHSLSLHQLGQHLVLHTRRVRSMRLDNCNVSLRLSYFSILREDLTRLHLEACPRIRSLAGLELLANLTTLHLEKCNGPFELGPLAGLTRLAILEVKDCEIKSVAPLASLINTSLVCLSLQVTCHEWTLEVHAPKLRKLTLKSKNDPGALKPPFVICAPNLKDLRVFSTNLVDVSPTKSLVRLACPFDVDLENMLEYFPALKTFILVPIVKKHITTEEFGELVGSLAQFCPKLTHLQFEQVDISDCSTLVPLRDRIVALLMRNCRKFESIEQLKTFARLRHLVVDRLPRRFKLRLTTLEFDTCDLKSLEPLVTLLETSLENLSLCVSCQDWTIDVYAPKLRRLVVTAQEDREFLRPPVTICAPNLQDFRVFFPNLVELKQTKSVTRLECLFDESLAEKIAGFPALVSFALASSPPVEEQEFATLVAALARFCPKLSSLQVEGVRIFDCTTLLPLRDRIVSLLIRECLECDDITQLQEFAHLRHLIIGDLSPDCKLEDCWKLTQLRSLYVRREDLESEVIHCEQNSNLRNVQFIAEDEVFYALNCDFGIL